VSIAGPDRAATHAAAKEAPHVFVSFASEDIELARRAVHSLERAGFRCWLSERDIEPAASYPAAITDALARSGALLLILTESANASPHVLREIELAFNARIPILPIRLSGVVPSSDLTYFLSTTQWFDAGSGLDDADLKRVEHRLSELLRSGRSIARRITGLRSWPALAIGAAVLAAATATVMSHPSTWKQTWFTISGTEGLTLPGMIDEPGWTAGRAISDRPARGPMLNSRRSLATFPSSTASRRIVTTAVEHSANINFGEYLQKRGFDVTFLPVESDGSIDLHLIEKSLRPDTAIVSVMWANNETE
jgi:hypothetical protein